MEIVPDPLLVALFFPPFLIAVVGMWVILWKPLLDWMDERDAASVDARKEAARLEVEVATRLETLEVRLAATRTELADMRAASRADAAKAEAEVTSAARAAADAKVEAATAQIAEQTEIARRGLSDAARSIADDMATQVLGRPLQA